jgi:hypothetical protein
MVEKVLISHLGPSHLDQNTCGLFTIIYVHLRYIVLVLGSDPILNYQSLNTVYERKKEKKTRIKTRAFK